MERPLQGLLRVCLVLNAATSAVDRLNLIDSAELVLQSVLRALRKPHADRSPETPLTPNSDSLVECQHNVVIVEVGNASNSVVRGGDILEVHRAAAVKIDAAEYALTMMLTELREVMATPPIVLQPLSCPHPDKVRPTAVHDMVRAA